jgi:hypothetical protein
VVEKESEEGGVGKADGDRWSGQALDGGGEPPVVGQRGEAVAAGDEGKAGGDGGEVAEVKGNGAVEIGAPGNAEPGGLGIDEFRQAEKG